MSSSTGWIRLLAVCEPPSQTNPLPEVVKQRFSPPHGQIPLTDMAQVFVLKFMNAYSPRPVCEQPRRMFIPSSAHFAHLFKEGNIVSCQPIDKPKRREMGIGIMLTKNGEEYYSLNAAKEAEPAQGKFANDYAYMNRNRHTIPEDQASGSKWNLAEDAESDDDKVETIPELSSPTPSPSPSSPLPQTKRNRKEFELEDIDRYDGASSGRNGKLAKKPVELARTFRSAQSRVLQLISKSQLDTDDADAKARMIMESLDALENQITEFDRQKKFKKLDSLGLDIATVQEYVAVQSANKKTLQGASIKKERRVDDEEGDVLFK